MRLYRNSAGAFWTAAIKVGDIVRFPYFLLHLEGHDGIGAVTVKNMLGNNLA
jgi:hypothetical protein